MNKILAFFILLFICNFSFAQQMIVFEQTIPNFINQIKREYTLPKSVTCTFKNGTKHRLVLERINGDSLIFRKYYNQTQNYDCVFSSLKKIKIHKKKENALYVLCPILASASIFLAYTSNYLILRGNLDIGDPSLSMTYDFLIPLSIISGVSAIIISTSFPKKYNPHNRKLYAK